ncbi:glycosyltransferase [Candidatus Leptofilum sp.]|uniref:glycosyltransferase family 2 protein n=1 Tax=Candidatus Leptofilum sp. TaxID=3241576 RepID=UPI003B596070
MTSSELFKGKKPVPLFLIFTALFIGNFLLVRFFNTLIWPYLWPQPGIYIVIGFIVFALWFPELFSGVWALRATGLLMIFVGECYVLHSFQVVLEDFSFVALLHLVGILGTFLVMLLSFLNQSRVKNNKVPHPLPEELPNVAAVIPTYGEPIHVLRDTLISLTKLNYPKEKLFILVSDDGHRRQVKALANEYGVAYNMGPRHNAKAGNLNSALDYLDDYFPQASLILTQDADEIIAPDFLKKVVGYFSDPEIAFVQTPKEAVAPPGDPFGVRDRVFYDTIQPGRNGAGAAFSCGSGVLWSVEAIKSIGGFATWNIVEDLTTSYLLHSAGYRSEYHNEILTVGLAPDDIPGLLKQRGTWATDTWRLFLFKNPIKAVGLTIGQRLQYLELGLFYVTSAFFMPILLLIPVISLLTGTFVPIEGSALFPWVGASFFYYLVLAKGRSEFLVRMWQYWISHAPTYHKAFWVAIRSRKSKPSYKVTRKTRQNGFYGAMLWPQFLYLFLGAMAILNSFLGLANVDVAVKVANVSVLLFFMFMVSSICKAAFYGWKPQLLKAIMTASVEVD